MNFVFRERCSTCMLHPGRSLTVICSKIPPSLNIRYGYLNSFLLAQGYEPEVGKQAVLYRIWTRFTDYILNWLNWAPFSQLYTINKSKNNLVSDSSQSCLFLFVHHFNVNYAILKPGILLRIFFLNTICSSELNRMEFPTLLRNEIMFRNSLFDSQRSWIIVYLYITF